MAKPKLKISSLIQFKQASLQGVGLSESQISEVQSKLLSIISKLLYVTQPFNIFNALLLAFIFQDYGNSQFLNSIASFLCCVSLCWLVWSEYFWRRNQEYITNRVAMRIHCIFSVAVASGFSLYSYYLFPIVGDEGRLVLVAVVTGMICGGAFALCMVPRAAFYWIIPLTVSSIHIGYMLGDLTFSIVLTCMILFYAALISTIILALHRTYLMRIAAEQRAQIQKSKAEYQKESMSVLMQDFEDHVSDWLWELDGRGKLSHLPSKIKSAIHLDNEQIIELDLPTLLSQHFHCTEADHLKKIKQVEEAVANQMEFNGVVLPIYLNDQVAWMSLSGKPLFEDDELIGWRGVAKDVTSEYTHKQEIERLAKTDMLTGLPNRFQFNKHASRFESGAIPFMIMLIDLDNFKEVNDVFGHHEGDKLLQHIAHRFTQALLPKEMIARLGGDEFILFSTEVKNAQRRARQILDCLAAPIRLTNTQVEIKASVGVSVAPQHGLVLDDLFKKADIAMYAAKGSGKGQFTIFNNLLEAENNKRIQMMSDLRVAVDEGQFFVEYQPQVDSLNHNVTGMEALVRWSHPKHGRVSPSDFIELAEETGQIISIGSYVLEQACQDAKAWPNDLKVSVNVSGLQCLSDNFIDMVMLTLDRTGLPPSRLELEVTESAIIENIDTVNNKLKLLKQKGISIALDDFGTGFSSLSYLQQLSIDTLKIDRSFITELDSDATAERSAAIVDVILKLAKGLNLSVTIEGVETETQLEKVNLLGGYTIQGYYFSKPLPLKEVRSFISEFTLPATSDAKLKA